MTPIVYVVMPTAMAPHAWATFERWRERGYRLALFVDRLQDNLKADLLICGRYLGVWKAANALARAAFAQDADVCLFAGDDMDPDPRRTAEELGAEYLQRFPDGFGVMQPCGDLQGRDESGKCAAARIAGSAWFGRDWARLAYGGNGPTDARYFHFYSDESLALVAEKLGVMWWRPDVIQMHRHWSFGHGKRQDYHERAQRHWVADQVTFVKSKQQGFPEGEPLR